jgi:hypothetical protein
MPLALSSSVGFRRHGASFERRWHKLQQLACLLPEAAAREGGDIRFVPEIPQCCQCHVYLGKGVPAADLDDARDEVASALGVRVYVPSPAVPSVETCGHGSPPAHGHHSLQVRQAAHAS